MLTKWNPFNGSIARSSSPMPAFDELFKEADNLFRVSFLGDQVLPGNWPLATSYAPSSEIVETEDAFELAVDLPGHDPKSLQLKVEGDLLTLQSERKQQHSENQNGYLCAERSYGLFSRSFRLPQIIDASRCEARYENGVLTVTMPKRAESKPKQVKVNVTGSNS